MALRSNAWIVPDRKELNQDSRAHFVDRRGLVCFEEHQILDLAYCPKHMPHRSLLSALRNARKEHLQNIVATWSQSPVSRFRQSCSGIQSFTSLRVTNFVHRKVNPAELDEGLVLDTCIVFWHSN